MYQITIALVTSSWIVIISETVYNELDENIHITSVKPYELPGSIRDVFRKINKYAIVTFILCNYSLTIKPIT